VNKHRVKSPTLEAKLLIEINLPRGRVITTRKWEHKGVSAMSHTKSLVFGVFAATLLAAGANAAVTQTTSQPFEKQFVQERSISGLDRNECRNLKMRGLQLPNRCFGR
jgi:hypothetical protein